MVGDETVYVVECAPSGMRQVWGVVVIEIFNNAVVSQGEWYESHVNVRGGQPETLTYSTMHAASVLYLPFISPNFRYVLSRSRRNVAQRKQQYVQFS